MAVSSFALCYGVTENVSVSRLSDYNQSTINRRSKRECFLAEMEAAVPWNVRIDLILPTDQYHSQLLGEQRQQSVRL